MSHASRAEQLQAILDMPDAAACCEFFSHATDQLRSEVSRTAIAAYKNFRKLAQAGKVASRLHTDTAAIAVLSACTLAEVKALGWRALPDEETAFEVLATRRPPWLSQFAEWLIAENARAWPLVRTLVRRGLCDRPQHDNYILGMMLALNGFSRSNLIGTDCGSLVDNLRKHSDLLADEVWRLFQIEGHGELTLAAHDKYIGGKRPAYCWNLGLKELSQSGELCRSRLLDESLASLNRGFSQARVAWFSQFHEMLEPTIEERLSRQDVYLRLLASPVPPTVTFALNALEVIDRVRPLAASPLIESLQPVLTARHKVVAKRAVQWLDRLAQRESDCKAAAASAAAQALMHQSADVQKAALEVLAKHGSRRDPALKKLVAQAAALIAASLRKQLNAWLGDEAAELLPATRALPGGVSGGELAELEKLAAKLPRRYVLLADIPPLMRAAKTGRVEIKALEFGPLDVPRLSPATALTPVRDLAQWTDVCALFLEAPAEVDEGERVLEGLGRLCEHSPQDLEVRRQLGPLTKRIDKFYRGYCGPFLGMSLRDDVCGVVRAWLTGAVVTAKAMKDSGGRSVWNFADKDEPVWGGMSDAPALRVLSQRSCELAHRVALRQVRPLLSAATHRGGWVDPLAYVDRLREWHQLGEPPPHYDAVLALLRLAPDNRAAALERMGRMKGELAEASRYALGGEKPEIGETAAIWVAAARARQPWGDDPLVEKRFPGLGPGGGTVARYAWRFRPETYRAGGKTHHYSHYHIEVQPKLPEKVEKDLPTVLMNRLPKYASTADAAQVRWHGTVWPAGRESHLVCGTRLLANNIDWSEAEWGNKTYLEPLVDGDEPLGELARVALCLGLSAKEPGEHTLATDVLAAAIEDGRVDGRCLAHTLATFLKTAGVKPARWAKAFGAVARISPLHTLIVRLTLENVITLAGESLAKPPKDLHHLLELLLELLAESGAALTNPSTRDALGQITGSGKSRKAAQALLALQADRPASITEIALGAIQGRLARARRWTHNVEPGNSPTCGAPRHPQTP